jgi:uncharacterized membrane protein
MNMLAIYTLLFMITGIPALLVLNAILDRLLRRHLPSDEIVHTPQLLKGISFVMLGMLLTEITTPFLSVESIVSTQYEGTRLYNMLMAYLLSFWFICLLAALLSLLLSYLIYIMTHKGSKLFEQIANNNLGHTLFFAGCLLLFSLLAKAMLPELLDSIVPYVKLPGVL